MIVAGSILIFMYCLAMGILWYGFEKIAIFSSESDTTESKLDASASTITEAETIGFSLIIPFRNEAKYLPKLLQSLQQLSHPTNFFEIIFVDDASEDASVAIIKNALKHSAEISFKVIENKRTSASPKKDAITTAIKLAKFDWIITTDADCELPIKWLATFDAYIKTADVMFIAAPVVYRTDNSLVQNFQQLDGLSLQTVTMGSFGLDNALLCNGANLAYKKKAFEAVNGFSENDHIASGDDIFMLEKMKLRFPRQISFLKSNSATVITNPQRNWIDVLEQRIRWASKTSKQKNSISKILGILVLLMNAFILVGAIWCFFQQDFALFYTFIIGMKASVDLLIIKLSGRFFKIETNLFHYLLCILIYPFITVNIFVKSMRGRYRWKDRTFF